MNKLVQKALQAKVNYTTSNANVVALRNNKAALVGDLRAAERVVIEYRTILFGIGAALFNKFDALVKANQNLYGDWQPRYANCSIKITSVNFCDVKKSVRIGYEQSYTGPMAEPNLERLTLLVPYLSLEDPEAFIQHRVRYVEQSRLNELRHRKATLLATLEQVNRDIQWQVDKLNSIDYMRNAEAVCPRPPKLPDTVVIGGK